jgi:pimeloyl-ACP methyl ester carboxylesterase
MMKCEFLRFLAGDGVELQGVLYSPDEGGDDRCVLHVHGLAGNFYENRFLDELAARLTRAGFCFMIFNNRGHDYISDLWKNEAGGLVPLRGGAAYEDFTGCLSDIEGALDLLRRRGLARICLQGHSYGCNKVIYFQYKKQSGIITTCALLSPCDIPGLQYEYLADRFDQVFEEATRQVESGGGESLLPELTYGAYPMCARTYVQQLRRDTVVDIFPYRKPDRDSTELAAIDRPLLFICGNDGDMLSGDPADTLNLLAKKATGCPQVKTAVIDGANHIYINREEVLSQTIVSWLVNVMP